MGVIVNYIRYIDKAAAYYKAAGYDKSYDWAHFDDVPFATLNKPLSECRVALASTSEVTYKSGSAPDSELVMMEGGVYSIPADTPVDNLHSPSQVHDIHATNLDDVNSFFPITRLQELARAGRIRDVAKNTYGVGTSYSQQTTADVDGPEVLRRCREDGVDVALLVPV